MVKKKKQAKVVGSNNIVRTAIPKDLDKEIKKYQEKLQEKENNKKTGKVKKISYSWAGLQLAIKIQNLK